jgi:hypothetical protein
LQREHGDRLHRVGRIGQFEMEALREQHEQQDDLDLSERIAQTDPRPAAERQIRKLRQALCQTVSPTFQPEFVGPFKETRVAVEKAKG